MAKKAAQDEALEELEELGVDDVVEDVDGVEVDVAADEIEAMRRKLVAQIRNTIKEARYSPTEPGAVANMIADLRALNMIVPTG